jgi:hypothetical protein
MANFHYKNFEVHHKQRSFLVFYFYAKDPADYFESLLIQHEVPYERGEAKDMIRRHLFGIHKSHQQLAEKLNDETGNMYRKPFLSDHTFRNAILIFTLIAILVAIMGYVYS